MISTDFLMIKKKYKYSYDANILGALGKWTVAASDIRRVLVRLSRYQEVQL